MLSFGAWSASDHWSTFTNTWHRRPEIEISFFPLSFNFIFTTVLALAWPSRYLIESIVPAISLPSHSAAIVDESGVCSLQSTRWRHFRSFTSRWFVRSWLVDVKFVPRRNPELQVNPSIRNCAVYTCHCAVFTWWSLHHICRGFRSESATQDGYPVKVDHTLKPIIWTRAWTPLLAFILKHKKDD